MHSKARLFTPNNKSTCICIVFDTVPPFASPHTAARRLETHSLHHKFVTPAHNSPHGFPVLPVRQLGGCPTTSTRRSSVGRLLHISYPCCTALYGRIPGKYHVIELPAADFEGDARRKLEVFCPLQEALEPLVRRLPHELAPKAKGLYALCHGASDVTSWNL